METKLVFDGDAMLPSSWKVHSQNMFSWHVPMTLKCVIWTWLVIMTHFI